MEEWVTVKDYAETHGITIQAVYQQLKRKKNKAFIDEHSKVIKGIKYLDQDAVEYLENQRENSPTVVVQNDNNERIKELEAENKLLNNQIKELQNFINNQVNETNKKVLELSEQILLLSQEPRKKHHWWNRRKE